MRPRPTPRRGPSGCCSRRSPPTGRSCWPSRMRTGPSRRCSTSSTSSRAGRWPRPSCCCASGAPNCSTRGPHGRRGRSCGRLRWTRRPAAACSARARRCPSRPSDAWWHARAATRSSSSSSRPTCASAPRTARSRPPCTPCSPPASTRSTRSQRRLIEAGAIEGETFHVGGVEALVPALGRAGVQAALDALARRELVRPAFPFIAGQRAFRFGHALVRDAAYEAMPLATRADAHERLAGWLVGPRRRGARRERPHRHAARARPWRRQRAARAGRAARGAGARCGARVSPRRRRRCTGAATCRRRSPSSSAPWRSWSPATVPATSCCRPWGPPSSRSAAWSARSARRTRRRPPGSIACACAARSSARAWSPTGTPSRWTPPLGSSSPRTRPWPSRRSATTSASRGRAA